MCLWSVVGAEIAAHCQKLSSSVLDGCQILLPSVQGKGLRAQKIAQGGRLTLRAHPLSFCTPLCPEPTDMWRLVAVEVGGLDVAKRKPPAGHTTHCVWIGGLGCDGVPDGRVFHCSRRDSGPSVGREAQTQIKGLHCAHSHQTPGPGWANQGS